MVGGEELYPGYSFFGKTVPQRIKLSTMGERRWIRIAIRVREE
jgi:hypothetical protein